MAWFSGTEHCKVKLNATVEEALSFLRQPAKFKVALSELETAEKIEDNVWKWTLVEKKEKGISFQGVYVVEYTNTDSGSTWRTIDGNMDSQGELTVKEVNGETILEYNETIKIDLPVPKLIALAIKKIVAKEIKTGIQKFIDLSKAEIEKG